MENDFLLSRIPECYLAFPGTGHRKKDDRNQGNSEHWSRKLGYLYEVVTVGNASVALIVPIFDFGKRSVPVGKRYLIEKGIQFNK